MVDFSLLPKEVINIIINYTDVVVYRHGKYLNRISKDDIRYKFIKKIKQPIWFSKNRWTFYFNFNNSNEKRSFAMDHTIDPNSNRHFLCKREMKKYNDGSIRTYKQTNYIYDLEGKCRETVNYVM